MKARWQRMAGGAALVAASIALATGAVAFLESNLGVSNASPLYLVAVVACGVVSGTAAAILAAVASFLVYNFFFTEPLYTFAISDPGVLLSVLLLLFVGIVVGQLAALQRARAETAVAREHEARALFGISRALATRSSTEAALAQIATVLRDETAMERVWLGFGTEPAAERVAGDTATGAARPATGRVRVLQRAPGDEPARWSLVLQPGRPGRVTPDADLYRVRIEASGEALGSVWALRRRGADEPGRSQTRLLAAAADQVGQAIARDRIQEAAQAAEVARQGEALKTSLLQAVSHDFRTPLAVIRAAAGSLDAGADVSDADRHAGSQAIEREVEYLNRLVANLLDLSRIEAGVLRAEPDVYDLDDVVRPALDRIRPRLGARTLEVAIEPVAVRADAVLVDAALANILENALKYTPDGARIRVASRRAAAWAVLSVEDDGPGVPDDALGRLFEKFYRAPGARGGSRAGLGIGLAVVRGLVGATGGTASARPSELGGLAIDLALPVAPDVPPPGAGRSAAGAVDVAAGEPAIDRGAPGASLDTGIGAGP